MANQHFHVENLEDRQMLSTVTDFAFDAGALTIVGTENSDTITLSVSDNGFIEVGSEEKTIAADEIQSIFVFAAAGHDLVDLSGVTGGVGFTALTNVEIKGGNGDDTLIGTGGNDLIVGGLGHDDIFGDAGNDTIHGGSITLLGDVNQDESVNFLDTSPFVNLLSTGEYIEEADINQDGEVSFLDINPYIALLSSGGEILEDEGDDNLYGGDGDDELYGNQGLDFIYGGDGDDTAFGGGGYDTVLGGQGNDELFGGDERDGGFAGDFDYINNAGVGDLLFGDPDGWTGIDTAEFLDDDSGYGGIGFAECDLASHSSYTSSSPVGGSISNSFFGGSSSAFSDYEGAENFLVNFGDVDADPDDDGLTAKQSDIGRRIWNLYQNNGNNVNPEDGGTDGQWVFVNKEWKDVTSLEMAEGLRLAGWRPDRHGEDQPRSIETQRLIDQAAARVEAEKLEAALKLEEVRRREQALDHLRGQWQLADGIVNQGLVNAPVPYIQGRFVLVEGNVPKQLDLFRLPNDEYLNADDKAVLDALLSEGSTILGYRVEDPENPGQLFDVSRDEFYGNTPYEINEAVGRAFVQILTTEALANMTLSGVTHATLDVIGLIPFVGEAADVVNFVLHSAEGNVADAAISALAVIPLAGTVATSGRYATRIDDAIDALRGTGRLIDEAEAALRALKCNDPNELRENAELALGASIRKGDLTEAEAIQDLVARGIDQQDAENIVTRSLGEFDGHLSGYDIHFSQNRLGGDPADIPALRLELEENGVDLVQGEEAARILDQIENDDGVSPGAAFGVSNETGEATIYLRPNATEYEVLHETLHMQEWLLDKEAFSQRGDAARELQNRIDSEDYRDLSHRRKLVRDLELAKAEATLAAEEYVYQAIRDNHWEDLNPDEKLHAVWYIEQVRSDVINAQFRVDNFRSGV